jgi:membrane protein DedA with SNARE-associated domain
MKDTLEFLVHHGYIVLFASVLAQQVGLLLLSTPFIVAAGALAHSGHLSFGVTIFVAFCAARRNLSRSLHWTSAHGRVRLTPAQRLRRLVLNL